MIKTFNRSFSKFLTVFAITMLIISMPGFGTSTALALTTTVTDNIPGASVTIPDPVGLLSCTTSINRSITFPLNVIIADIDVGLNISHSRRSDVRVTLTSPAGTAVELISGGGLGFPVIASPDDYDNYDVLLDDSSTNSLYDNDIDNVAAPFYDRSARPFEALSAFKGENTVGAIPWTLSICDTRNGSETGALGDYNNAQLIVTSADPNTVSGIVFTDYNDNGVREQGDVGVPGVLVTAYDATGNQVAQTTTLADGSYTFTGAAVADGTQLRIEFTNIPSNLRPGAFGVDSGTTVQFVTSPAAGVDMGLAKPDEYCQSNPFLVSPCYINGNPLVAGTAADAKVLVSIPYDAYGRQDDNIENTLATGAQIGATWGLAFQRSTGTIFAGALAKRHAGLGSLGAGGIYTIVMNPLTGAGSTPVPFVNLATLGIPTGGAILGDNTIIRQLPATASQPNTDPTAWDAVGKVAIGDMDMGSDDTTLWVMNLFNQTLYAINVNTLAFTNYSITPTTLQQVGATACPAASDIRPWAIEISRGNVYVGVVCSAESTQNVSNLRAYVLSMSETPPGLGTFSLITEFALNYDRGFVTNPTFVGNPITGFPADWRPWSRAMTSLCAAPCATQADLAFGKQIIYPQPILADIEFDTNGDMILGFMDRLGHQTGNANYATSNPWGNVTVYNKDTYATSVAAMAGTDPVTGLVITYEGVSAGDTIRLCSNGVGGFVLESNAFCGGITTGGAGSVPAQGPGGGEYYWQDMHPPSTLLNSGIHNETTLGGLLLVPGTNEIAVSVFDPFDLRAGGIAWFNNLTGTRTRAYEVFGIDAGGGAATFGKAAGLGDVEGFCFAAPIEIGNRVWIDTDNDGVQDADETPIAGVTVELWLPNGTSPIAIVVTDANGNYFFSSGPGTDSPNHEYLLDALNPNLRYEIRIPLNQPALAGLTLTINDSVPEDQRDSDGISILGNAVVALTTGSAGDNNHTFDFGFTGSYSLGNRVWFDTNNDSIRDAGEFGVDDVVVQLYSRDALGNFTLVGTKTTAGGGYYRFDGLPAGDYVVIIPEDNFRDVGVGDLAPGNPLIGYWSSATTMDNAGVVSETPADNADTDSDDNDDNGTLQNGGTFVRDVVSSVVTLGPPALTEPVNEPDVPLGQGAIDSRANMTVDFGFYRLELGDLVFEDFNNNGTFDAGDVRLQFVLVQLFAANGTTEIITGADGIPGTADDGFGPDGAPGGGDDGQGGVLTDANGNYLFRGLPQGSYIVKATGPVGYTSTIDNYPPAGNDNPNPNTNADNNDNGIGTGAGLTSGAVITLTPGSTGALNNNTVTQNTGITRNPTMDFGFVQANAGILKTVTPSQATIGEIVTYTVQVTVPPGTFDNAQLVDTMKQGLALFDCVNITGAGVTTSLGAFGCAGNVTTAPATGVDIDRIVTFNLGNVTNAGQTDRTITVTYRAIVLDIAANVGAATQTTLDNSAELTWSGPTLPRVQRTITVVEPDLQIQKSANTNFVAIGTEVEFTLTVTHTANSRADAFDVVITDVIPTQLDYVANSIDCDDGDQDAALVTCTYDALTRTIIGEWSAFTRILPVSNELIIRFRVAGNATLPPNGSVTNVGNVEWTSRLGDQTTPDSFSTNPPNPFATERFYDPTSPNPINTIYGDNDAFVLNPVGGGGGNNPPTSLIGGFLIPVTGFAPGRQTLLNGSAIPSYSATVLALEIPAIKVKSTITGVQLKDGNWDVSWLQNQAGWLEGTAYPTWSGNSVLTAHTVNADGKPGLFSHLKYLRSGDYIFVYNSGYRYIYKVVSNEYVQPDDISVLQHEDSSYLTLITCDRYDGKTGTYLRRVVVRAMLVDVSLAK